MYRKSQKNFDVESFDLGAKRVLINQNNNKTIEIVGNWKIENVGIELWKDEWKFERTGTTVLSSPKLS